MEKKGYLDWIRVAGVCLVLYGHLANAALRVTSEATVFSTDFILPISDETTHKAYILDSLLAKFNTTSASIGVVLFLWLTGYLTAMTRRKYTGKEFLFKRIVRLYPGLILAVIICGIVAFVWGGVKHSVLQYVSNALLLHTFMGFEATIGPLWTLLVEMVFYCIMVHFTDLHFRKIVIIDSVILFFITVQAIYGCGAYVFLLTLKYIAVVLFGSMMYEFHEVRGHKKYMELLIVAMLSYSIMYISITYTYTGEFWYKSPFTYIFAFVIWELFYLLRKMNFMKNDHRIIKFIVDTSYLVYLFQINIAFMVMYFLGRHGVNPYLNIIGGVTATYIIATTVHYECEVPLQKYLNKKLKKMHIID